jgi:release factor glutamine methyltransferase
MISRLKQLASIRLIKLVQRFGPRKVEVLGRTYEISRHVFNPRFYFTSRFMAKNLIISKGDVVLDMGTGSGIQAITAGGSASKVIAIDINPEAVKFARKNVIANNLGDFVSVVEGDLFSPLKPEPLFNTILFTPPYMEGSPETDFEYALYDRNKRLIKRFFKEAGDYLKPGGNVQMLYSSIAGHNEALEIAARMGWKYSLVAHERTVTESFFIYKLSLS